ncbi:hypothetical protein [Streptomyces sp. NPDC048172]|uniref:hypothetical protein n=1 Tax=Streptomyces sp. NPDC048172 TaxID=3365505 RepID=UPI003722E9A6
MVFVHHSLLTATFLVPDPALLPGLRERLPRETLQLLRVARSLPTALLDQVLASGERRLLEALAAGDNRRAWFDSGQTPALPGTTPRKDALVRLAALGEPALAKSLFDGGPRQLRRAVLAAAADRPDDPGWRGPGGLVETLLSARDIDTFGFALCAPFPDVVRWARRHLGELFRPYDQVFVCRRAVEAGGVDALRGILAEGSPAPVAAEVLRQSLRARDPIDAFPYDARVVAFVDGVRQEQLLFPSDLAPDPASRPGPDEGPDDALDDAPDASPEANADPARVAELLALDEPETNARIFLHARPSDEQRAAILEGRPFGPDAPPGTRLPLADELVAAVCRDSGAGGWLWSSYASGHPRLARALLGKHKLLTPARRLALVVALWERSGPDAVQALLDETRFPGRKPKKHPLTYETHQVVQHALRAPDGLDLLRGELAYARSPGGRLDHLLRLRTPGQCMTAAKALVREMDDRPPWPELVAAHRRAPLRDHLLAVLAERPDVPGELRGDCAAALVRVRHPEHARCRSSEPVTALDLLRRHPHPDENWLRLAYRFGQLTPTDTLREARPVRFVVQHLQGPVPTRLNQPLARPFRCAQARARRMARARLGTDLDAWARAARLLPEYEGSFPELLATAEAGHD